jgi:Flp pilus assembly pilin Flp
MNRATGQASSEYLVVLAFCVIVLITAAAGPAPVKELIQAIKDFFSAYSYAISVTP